MATGEKPEARALRERQRVLFDGVANLYAESRRPYPAAIVQWMAEMAGLAGWARVLEIGCGTGQLTCQLAQLPIQLTAIDLGPANEFGKLPDDRTYHVPGIHNTYGSRSRRSQKPGRDRTSAPGCRLSAARGPIALLNGISDDSASLKTCTAAA